MSTLDILKLCYLLGSVSFIVGLKMLAKPDSAKRGNMLAAIGMTIAILGTIFFHKNEEGKSIGNLAWIFGGIAIGTIVGYLAAMKVKMTQMPQMVSLFNGMGGACAALIGIVEMDTHNPELFGERFTIFLGLMIGTVSFAGSIVAYGKLEGKVKDYGSKFQQLFNNTFIFAILALVVYASLNVDFMPTSVIWILFAASMVYGILFVLPIGGADMPVVISLLNSFTGVAAAFGGFLYHNQVMLTGGILVGSAGTILTVLMCKAMNRPLSNVIFGAFGGGSGATGGAETTGTIKDIQVTDLAVLLNYSKKVVIVPGYGLAVAQAQHIIHELEKILEERGVEVKYAIHPVAGRMPGHMNVLLAESNVEYDKLVEMEDINPEFEQTDVVLIVGANDVVNPAAKTDPSSPIYGMPILEVDKAKHVVVNKRSMNAGYAGIDNLLFYDPKCSMFFGDAKKALTELVSEIKQL